MISEETRNKILGELLGSPAVSVSMNTLSGTTALNYTTVFNAVPKLEKEGLVKTERKGNSVLVSPDLENGDIDSFVSAMIKKKEVFLKKNLGISVLLQDIEKNLIGKFYSLLLFGSYAKGEEKKDSDIDLMFIIPECESSDEYKSLIKKAVALHTDKKVHYLIVTSKDFMQMLEDKYTVGMEAFKNNILFFGIENYYSMVKKYAGKKGY